jgi:riboflavin kinase / FMN adenylyltransferase
MIRKTKSTSQRRYSSHKEVEKQPSNITAQSDWITIGSFDGVHLGHQKILETLKNGAQESRAKAAAISFFPHPAVVLRDIEDPFYITTLDEKNALLKRFGANEIINFTFDKDFSRLSPREFVQLVRERSNFSKLLIGYDFRLGADRAGGQEALKEIGKEMGFSVDVISPVLFDDQPVSSSRIRQALAEGNLAQANAMLGYPFFISGEVVHGDGRGKHIGLPTANVFPWPKKIIPAPGVYAAFTEIDAVMHLSVISIGYRPTFYGADAVQTIESHVLDYAEQIYEKAIGIHFIERLRPELKFDGVDALMTQIKYDIIKAKEILSDAAKPPNIPA